MAIKLRQTPSSRRVEITLAVEIETLSEERQQTLITLFSRLMALTVDQVDVLEVKTESVVVALQVPADGVKRFRAHLRAQNPQLALLRVERVVLEGELGEMETWEIHDGRWQRIGATFPTIPRAPLRIQWMLSGLVAGMISCLTWSIVQLIQLFFPEIPGSLVMLAALIAALEAPFSFRLAKVRRAHIDDVLKFRLIEIALLFVLAKPISYWGQSWGAILADIARWPHDPLRILNLRTGIVFLTMFCAWLVATACANDLDRLGEPPEKSRHYVFPADSLASRFFTGGSVLLIVTGLTAAGRGTEVFTNLDGLMSFGRTLRLQGAVNVLLYYVAGLVLMGQVRFALLRKGWLASGIPVETGIARRWALLSLALVAIAVVLALILPTGYSIGLLELLSHGFQWLLAIVSYIFGVLVFLFTLLLSPLFSLLGGGDSTWSPIERPRLDPVPPPELTAGGTPDWVLLLRAILFWSLMIAALVYIVGAYLRDRPDIIEALTAVRPGRWLAALWQALKRLFGRWRTMVKLSLPRVRIRRPSRPAGEGSPLRFFRLGTLSPRERILYYYWSLLRRAERLGLPRRPAETPREFGSTLDSRLPEVEGEIHQLTGYFVEARYSQHPVDRREERQARQGWKSVRAALRALDPRGEQAKGLESESERPQNP